MRLVWFEWVDSAEASHGWDACTDSPGAGATMQAVGYVVTETDNSITIACTIDKANGNALNSVTIWKPAITQIREVVWK